jgi:hypothetical protein
MRAAPLLLAALLAGCSGGGESGNATTPPDLETAAIERGVVTDPKDTSIAGLYARDTDRICIVPEGGAARIGVFVDYGDKITCSGSGKVTRAGETLHVELGGDDRCSFQARFEGDRIVFPGTVPAGCDALCDHRASFAAVEVERLSESAAEAGALRDAKGKLLCG